MSVVNLNDWAKSITLKEGKKLSLSIAQVKEVLHIILHDIKFMPLSDLVRLLKEIK